MFGLPFAGMDQIPFIPCNLTKKLRVILCLSCSIHSYVPHLPGQVRVVRFIRVVLLLLLLLPPPPSSSSFSSSASSSSSTTSASTSTSTVALPTLGQALRQLRSSVRTAGPPPRTFPAQGAPLDLNLGPSQLSAHRWTST